MSNVEHLFENAIVALENDYYFGEWKRTQKEIHNTDGVSEEVLEAIWELAIYTKYTYEPSLNAIPIEWLKNKSKDLADAYWNNVRNKLVLNMNELPLVIDEIVRIWEKENEIS